MDSPTKTHPRHAEASIEELRRLAGRQQTVVDLGLRALSGASFAALVDEAVALVAENLSTEYCAALELLEDGKRLLLRSGVGWDEGVVGEATLDTDMDLLGGYTLISRGTVVVGSLREEHRFDIPRLVRDDHGTAGGLSTPIHAGERIYGFLGAYTLRQRWFTQEEANFLEAVAKVLGAANERELAEENVRLRLREETGRAEAAERRFRLLSEVNELLCAPLDRPAALAGVASLAVPALADLCFVDVIEDGTLDRLVVTRADGVEEGPARELRQDYQLDSTVRHGTPKVLRTGRPELIPEVGDKTLTDLARGDGGLRALHRLGPRSYMCVPFQVRRQLVGAIGFVSAEPGRRYDSEDLALAESLSRCAALAADRALRQMALDPVQGAEPDRETKPAAGPGTAPALTARQLQVLRLLSEGKPARRIGEQLRVSETTVRNHIRALLHALGAHSQLEAVARARQAGLLAE